MAAAISAAKNDGCPLFRARSGDYADQEVSVEINRIGAGRRRIIAAETRDLPGTLPEKILSVHRGKGSFQTPVYHSRRRQDLLRISTPNDLQLGVAIHRAP